MTDLQRKQIATYLPNPSDPTLDDMEVYEAAKILAHLDKFTMRQKYAAWATMKHAGCIALLHKTDLAKIIDELWEVVGMETTLGRAMDQIDKKLKGEEEAPR